MSMDYAALGRRIKDRRKAQRKTQEDLAEALWVSVGYISQIERGVTKVNLDTLSEIACILECDLGELVTGLSSGGEDYLARELSAILDGMDHRQRRLLLDLAQAVAHWDQAAP